MVFKQVGNDTDSLINKFGILNKSFANIKKDFQNGQGLRSFGNIVSKQDIANFEKFQKDLQNGISYHKAFNNNLANSHSYIQQQASSLRELITQRNLLNRQLRIGKITQEEYKTAITANQAQITALTTKTQALTLAQKASAVASKAAGVALNMLGNIAIMAGINLIITVITKLVNKQKELREASEESANKYKEQTQSLKDLRQQYIDIVDSENDVSKKTEELNEWKQTLIETYGFEKEALENVNLEREKGLDLLDAEIAANNRKSRNTYLEENKSNIQKAYAELGKSSTDTWYSQIIDETDGISKRISKLFDDVSTKELSYGITDVSLSLNYEDEYDRLDKLKNLYNEFIEIKRNKTLTDSESRLFQWIKDEIKVSEEAIANLGTYYETASKYNVQNLIEDYTKTDNGKIEKVGRDTFISWKNGLLSQAKNAGERNELSKYIEEQFPDYTKYFDNLSSARQKFIQPSVSNAYAAEWVKEIDNFLTSLSETDLEASLNIPDLFADGLEGATAKIEAWKADPKNKITPEVETDDTEISAMLETVSKKVKLITTAMEEMNDTGYISSSTYAEIVEMGGNFADCLEVQNGKLKLNVEKLKDLEKQELRNELAEIRLSKASWETVKATKAMGGEDTSAVDTKLRELTKQEAVINQAISEITNAKPKESGSGGSSSNSDPWKEQFDKQYSEKQHLLAMEQLSEEDYLDWLDGAYKQYFSDLTKYQDEYYKYEEEVYKGRKQLLEDYYDTQQKYLEDRIDSLESQVDVTLNTSTTSDGTELSTKEKYEYIKDTYQEIINEIETFKNEIINNGIEGHEELVAELEKQVEEYQQKIEDTFRTAVEEEKDYIEKLKDSYIDSYDERIDKIKEQKEAAEEAIQAEIDALKKVNDEKQRTNDLEKAKQKLENAKKQRTRAVLGADGTMSYQVDQDKIDEAQQEYDDAMLENQIAILEEQKEIQSNGYNTLIENLENEQEAGERRFDILLKVLDEYLNPDNTTSNSDVWSKLAKMQGAKYENGTWYDKDGKAINVENLVKSAETKTDDKKKAETDNSKSETDSALKKFLTNMEKQFNLDAGSLTLEKIQQAFGNSISANYNSYGAMNEKTGLTGNGYTSYVNNENANITSTFNGDIIINNPVGNSNDLAQEIIKNLPSAINRQTHK